MKAFSHVLCALVLATTLISSRGALAQEPVQPISCGDPLDKKKEVSLEARTDGKRLVVVGNCVAGKNTYIYGDVNIYGGGALTFKDEVIDFWAKNIVVENDGALLAGVSAPIGTAGGKLAIHLYGADQGVNPGGVGVDCIQKYCGIPETTWASNGETKVQVPNQPQPTYFYPYGPLMYDGGALPASSKQGTTYGFFGYKVLAVSYGGTLRLSGLKGVKTGNVNETDSGLSWVRLARTVIPTKDPANREQRKLLVDRVVNSGLLAPRGWSWAKGDKIVLTTTDYLPGHSEELTIEDFGSDGQTLYVKEPIKYRHQGEVYQLRSDMSRLNLDKTTAETRAAVGLLSRSIQIVSEGSTATPGGFAEAPGVYFGGHVIARQGFRTFQVQGVEFRLLGQGGRIGHYPVHFHHVQDAPPDTYVKDSSVNESMTRWMVLHATNKVTLARNVTWKSIGHGFYIEDGNEIDNKLLTNLAVYARPAIDEPNVNPRKVPGILAADRGGDQVDHVPFYTDVDHPTAFWIMNGWNDFRYNMVAGAGMCGTCYWLLPGANSGHSRHEPLVSNLTGYSALQASLVTTDPIVDDPLSRAGLTPLRSFAGNSCTAAMNSFSNVGDASPCYGSGFGNPKVAAVPNPFALPKWCDQTNPVVRDKDNKVIGFTPQACANPANMEADMYYPKVTGLRKATLCDPALENCMTVPACDQSNRDRCAVTVIDKYTSSFHSGAETNFGAIWLRGNSWLLFTNSVVTDAQNAGFSMVSGGGYTVSDVLPGRWALVRKTVFIGSTQDHTLPDASGYASPYGPFNPNGLKIGVDPGVTCSGQNCLAQSEGISVPVSNFAMNQRLFNIYDGPTYQDSNAYLDIRKLPVADCSISTNGANCNSMILAGRTTGLPYDKTIGCYMPNAAIAWKQPNGFYYPPAFHSLNLYFDDGTLPGAKHTVDIRHFVIEPLFVTDSYVTDVAKAKLAYCNWNTGLFNGYTDVDRQTELSDDDGSLTGYQQTVSVNNDAFFTTPTEEVECQSDGTAKTSPYDYVTSVVYPACANGNNCCLGGSCGVPKPVPFWDRPCSNEFCFGIPIYRQLRMNASEAPAYVRMAGQSTNQRSTLTPNNGKFYIDTTASLATQRKAPYTSANQFVEGQDYYLFLLYAKPDTKQTYQVYVGDGFDPANSGHLWATRVDPTGDPYKFEPISGWPSTWTRQYANGVLTVTMDMTEYKPFKDAYNGSFEDLCQPSSFCSWTKNDKLPTGGTCGCNASGLFAAQCADLNNSKQDVCAAWAQKDVDCPKGGCYGFGFKIAKMTYDVDKRPAAEDFPPGLPWFKPWTAAVGGIAQACTPKVTSSGPLR